MYSTNKYVLPVPKSLPHRIDRASSPKLVGNLRNAVDIMVLEDTPVLAAADGLVTFVKDDSNLEAQGKQQNAP
jgi:hypothetical protein